jgi:hypothetical protein
MQLFLLSDGAAPDELLTRLPVLKHFSFSCSPKAA